MKKCILTLSILFCILIISGCAGLPSSVAEENQPESIRTILQTGHSRRITDVAFSGDGKIAATVAYDGKILVWRVSDGLITHTLGQDAPIRFFAVTLSSDGKYLVAGGEVIQLYDLEKNNLIETIRINHIPIKMEFATDDSYLFSCGNERNPFPGFEDRNKKAEFVSFSWVNSADKITGSYSRNVLSFNTSLRDLAIHPENSSAMLLDFDGLVYEISLPAGGKKKLNIDGQADGIAFTPKGNSLILTGNNHLTEYEDGKAVQQWDIDKSMSTMHLSSNGKIIGFHEKFRPSIQLFTFPDFEILTTISHSATESRWYPDYEICDENGQVWLAGGTWQSSILNCHNAESGEVTIVPSQFPYELNGLEEYDRAGTILSAHTSDKYSFISLFDLEELTFSRILFDTNDSFEAISKTSETNMLLRHHRNYISDLNFDTLEKNVILSDTHWQGFKETADGKLLFRKQSDSNLYLYNIERREQELLFELNNDDIVYYDSTGEWAVIILYSKDGSAIVLNTETQKTKTLSKEIYSSINTFHPSKPVFYYYGENDEFISYDCLTGGKSGSKKFKGSGINQMGLSPDGSILVSTNFDNSSILISDAESLKTIQEIPMNRYKVDYISISSDNLWAYIGTNGDNIHIISLQTGEVVDLYVYPDDWVLFTPDGYFTGSAGAGKLLAIVQGDNAFGIDQFAATYNRPDIIMDRLGLENNELLTYYQNRYKKRLRRLGIEESIMEKDIQVPEVIIEDYRVEQREVNLSAILSDENADLISYNIFINDVPLFGSLGKTATGNNMRVEEFFLINPGKNKIELSCKNNLGNESFRTSFYLEYNEPVSSDLYFLGFGVSEYSNSDLDLKYAHKDAEDLEIMFGGMETDLYEQVFTRTYINEQVLPAIVKDAKKFLLDTKPEDTVILFIAGHGVHSFEKDPIYYYLTHNADIDNLPETALKFSDLEQLLHGIPARQKLFLMDTCESGEINPEQRSEYLSMADDNGFSPRSIRGLSVLKTSGIENAETSVNIQEALQDAKNRTYLTEKDRYINNDLFRRSGAIVLSSCRGGEFSYEIDDIANGFFTEAFLNAFNAESGADLDENNTISTDELLNYVGRFVTTLSGGLQNPTVDRDNIYIDFGFPVVK